MDNELSSRARQIAAEALAQQTRYDGSPFIGHADGVAKIVTEEIGLPDSCAAAVYLHEACRMGDAPDISGFPQDVRMMVDGLNKISTIKPKDTRLEAEKYKKLIVQYSTDPRVSIIKIADRLEVMRNLEMFPKMARDQKLLETQMLYMPLAHQLGLYNINSELGNIYLRHVEPEKYRAITNKLKATEKDRERLMLEFIEPLKKKLSAAGIQYKLKVRTKSAWSIWRKMQVQKVPFEGIFDVFAIRFIIDCPEDPAIEKNLCWQVYSYVTEEYEPDTKRLRDWVTTPRPSGYESLHITVKNKMGNFLEVQIRTARMDEAAEKGIAAHWAYKGIKQSGATDTWLKSVREALEHHYDAAPEDLPSPPEDEIFVFTPTGELRMLKAGSSVLDFAFSIHSGLGARCSGAIVNGKAVQIKEKLKTGDTVEILTSKSQRPNRDWLNWVVTSKARSKIKLELDADERKKAAEGREILERRLRNWKIEFPDDIQAEFMKLRGYKSVLPFMAAIAKGEVDVNDIKAFVQEKASAPKEEAVATEHKEKTFAYSGSGEDILVLNARNVKGLDYKMAACCNPVFGDDVFGFVTRSAGIKIHRISCPNAARLLERYPYRIQRVIWQETAAAGSFLVTLLITAEPETSVLGSIMDVVSQFKASIRSFNVGENRRNGTSEITMKLLVPSNMELDKVISQVAALKQVLRVKRQ